MFSNILYINLCWPIYVKLTKTRVIGDERASVEKNAYIRLTVILISMEVKGPTGCHRFSKKTGKATHEKQASKQHPSMTSASATDHRFMSALSSYPDFLP